MYPLELLFFIYLLFEFPRQVIFPCPYDILGSHPYVTVGLFSDLITVRKQLLNRKRKGQTKEEEVRCIILHR